MHFERRGDAKPPAGVFIDVHGVYFRILYVHTVFEIWTGERPEATNCRFTRRSVGRYEDGQGQLDELFVLITELGIGVPLVE